MRVMVQVTLEEGWLVEGSVITVTFEGQPPPERGVLEVAPRHTWPTRVALVAEALGRLPWSFLIDLLIRLKLWPHGLRLTEGVPLAGPVLELEASARS